MHSRSHRRHAQRGVGSNGANVTSPEAGEGRTTGETTEGGVKAAWDEGEEDADLDALLGEAPAPNPDMAEMWRTDPELWARLSRKAAGRR